jgi:hypothetical protein
MNEGTSRKVLKLAEQNYVALLQHPHDNWRIRNQRTLCDARELVSILTGETGQEVQDRFENVLWDVHELCDMLNRKV